MRANACLLILGCVLAAIAGCSEGPIATESVVGVVTLDGQPVADAMVNFSPATPGQGAPSYGKTDEKGQYKLQTLLGAADAGTTPGEYVVSVSKSVLKPTGKVNVSPEGKEIPEEKPEELLPVKYTDTKTSGLTASVKQGANEINFDLKSN